MAIRIGTSGFAYSHWRGVLYPAGLPVARWLALYARAFSTVEMNATFYRLPPAGAAAAWRAQTPPGFAFACKGSRFLTHMKRLLDVSRGPARFFERVAPLGDKLRVVLWQLPPQMSRPDAARLDRFLGALPRDPGVRHAVEFRHENWYEPAICDVLDRHRSAFCEHDLVPRAPPRRTGGFRYLRFHRGRTALGRYGPARLRDVAADLLDWERRTGGDAFVYFNNDARGAALFDARDLALAVGQPCEIRLARPAHAAHPAHPAHP